MDDTSLTSNREVATQTRLSDVSWRQWATVAILTFVNLINYMDRFTIAGILQEIKEEYQISNAQAGALQTAFIVTYMLLAPLFGYLGDRYSRKLLMTIGVLTWSIATLLASFMPNYGGFLAMRAFIGVGEASYSTIAPTIIRFSMFKLRVSMASNIHLNRL